MKQRPKGTLFLWVLIAAVAAGGTFLICEHREAGVASGVEIAAPVTQPDAAAQQDAEVNPNDQQNISVNSTTPAVPMQQFSNDGYVLNIPASWSIEMTASDTIALHPNATSQGDTCKIEVSAFPFASGTDVAGWIGERIGADPSLSIVEKSSEDVSVNGGSGVKWIGTIDGLPTTLVYLFGAGHAYEIAPSVIGDGVSGDAQCDGMLGTLLSTIKI